MKDSYKLEIPIIPITLFIFIGDKGLECFKKEVQKIVPGFEPNLKMCGYHNDNNIWMHEYDRKTLFHELMHFIEWVFNYLDCNYEKEFKAYLCEYIFDESLKLLEGKK